ncbi:hypothetical protein BsWGS_14199 [Bradybaena similaris]
MHFFKNVDWHEMLLICLGLLVVSTHAQNDFLSPSASGGTPRTCERLRLDIALLFEQVYEKIPSLLNVMMDAAQDPRTGKRVDFGVEVMKKMIVNAFTSFLPVCAQQHRRNEQGEVLKTSIPSWYFSSLRSQNPPSRFLTKGGNQKQPHDGLPLKLRRRKRGSSNSEIPSDVIMIPVDFIDQGGEEEEPTQISLDITG